MPEYCNELCVKRQQPEAICPVCEALAEREKFLHMWFKFGFIKASIQCLVTGFKTLLKRIGFFAAERPIALAFCVFLLAAIIVGIISYIVKPDKFLEGALIEATGMVFDLLVISFFVSWLNRLGDRQREIRRYREEIEDYLDWESDVARHRIQRIIYRLNEHNVTDICLVRAYLNEANLSRVQLRKANLNKANLHKADLIGADLTGANLCDANLSEAVLWSANLHGANLDGTDLRGANLSTASNLTQDQLSEIKWDSNTKLPQGLSTPPWNLIWREDWERLR